MNGNLLKANDIKTTLILGILVVLTSVLVALVEVIFSYGITLVTTIRINTISVLWMLALPIVGWLILKIYQHTHASTMDVMGALFDIYHYKDRKLPLILIPLALVSTWLTHLCGGSVGREGVAVQVGGLIGMNIGSTINSFNITHKRILVYCAMAAGFAGLFLTPWTAMFFVLEIAISGMVDTMLLIPCGFSAFIASMVASWCGLHPFTYGLTITGMDWTMLIDIILMSIIFGLIGGWFGRSIHWIHDHLIRLFHGHTTKMMVTMACVIAIIMVLTNGRYAGLSTDLEHGAFSGDVYWFDFLFKFGLTSLCLGIGLKGGEVAPLFVIGSTLGAFMASLLNTPVEFGAALGYICVFASGTNTLIAPMFLVGESFGFANVPFFAFGVIISYAFNFNHSIYSHQMSIHQLLDEKERNDG